MLRACTRQRILTMSEAKNRAILNALPDLMFIKRSTVFMSTIIAKTPAICCCGRQLPRQEHD